MLNDKGVRELAYVVRVDGIRPIEGADNVELAIVGGWQVMVRKGMFYVGMPAIYFEIDSKVPETKPFEFLAKYHYKVKTQKYFKGTVLSQGLLMLAEDFGWETEPEGIINPVDKEVYVPNDDSAFLTEKLKVKYAVEEDNIRKAKDSDVYKRMAQKHPEVFKKPFVRWLMHFTLGKKMLYLIYSKDVKKSGWPVWVQKTDEERCQNLTGLLFNGGAWSDEDWIVTEKIDGSSTTFTIKRGRCWQKPKFYVCSRNVVFDTPEKSEKCFYDSNIYLKMAAKYDIKNKMLKMLEVFPKAKWITIQGETYGKDVQKRDYSIDYYDFKAFNFITSENGRWNSLNMKVWLEDVYKIPCVPIIDIHYHLPNTIEELLEYAEGQSALDGKEREGIVLRSQNSKKSFKAVSNDYLMKYHQ